MIFPSQFHCHTAADFIGPARGIAAHLEKKVRLAAADRPPLLYFFTGPAGVGKSDLARFLTRLLGGNQWTTYEKAGCSFRIEDVEEWARVMHLREMFGTYRVFCIEEADGASPAARSALRVLLDRLPPGNAFICTTNKPVKEFDPSLQRRFAFFEVAPPTAAEIAALLSERFGLDPRAARNTAQQAVLMGGYVGQALKDAEEWLVAQAPDEEETEVRSQESELTLAAA